MSTARNDSQITKDIVCAVETSALGALMSAILRQAGPTDPAKPALVDAAASYPRALRSSSSASE